MNPTVRVQTQQSLANANIPRLLRPPANAQPTRKSSKRHNRRQYCDAVNAYSKLSASNSLYAGLHFENLAGYLLQPYKALAPPDLMQEISSENIDVETQNDYKFVSLYDLDPATSNQIRHIHNTSDFEEAVKGLSASTYGQLLFMRGHPSPQWLTTIGAQYELDPDFFQRHLDFRPQRPNYFSLPSLPSSSKCMLRLRIATIGCARSGPKSSQEALDALRSQNTRRLQEYYERLRSRPGLNLGDSIVRDCSVHDMHHFTIEQDISIYVKPTDKSWTAFVWLDNGKNLGDGITSWLALPLQRHIWNSTFKYLPVVQHRLGIALERRSPRLITPLESTDSTKIFQSASLLHLDYGRDMDSDILGTDSFYALSKVFSFAAFADAQFLNMLDLQLANELDSSALIEQKNPTLSNLLYNQRVLERFIQGIQSTIICIEGRASGDWPSGMLTEDKRMKVDATAMSLIRDYQYLLSRAENLCEQCNRGMQIIMNNVNLKESREAMSQAGELAKLTRLAFVFIPLSFTTSFFGMNVRELTPVEVSLWVWFAATIPLFILSVLFMNYNILEGVRSCISWIAEARKGRPK